MYTGDCAVSELLFPRIILPDADYYQLRVKKDDDRRNRR
jgi:hypothetical protein